MRTKVGHGLLDTAAVQLVDDAAVLVDQAGDRPGSDQAEPAGPVQLGLGGGDRTPRRPMTGQAKQPAVELLVQLEELLDVACRVGCVLVTEVTPESFVSPGGPEAGRRGAARSTRDLAKVVISG